MTNNTKTRGCIRITFEQLEQKLGLEKGSIRTIATKQDTEDIRIYHSTWYKDAILITEGSTVPCIEYKFKEE